MKALKWVLIFGGGLVVLVIAALLVIPFFVDVNRYKPQIEKQVAGATGRPFSIGGDLKFSLFPWAGVALSDLRLGSPQGFEEKDLLFVKSFDVRMKLLPLLSRDIQVERFVIEGPRMVLEKNKAGRGNWEGLGRVEDKVQTPAEPRPIPGETAGPLSLKGLAVGEFALRNGSLLYVDRLSGGRHEVTDLSLELQDVSLDRPIRILLSALMNKVPLSMEGSIGPVGKEPGMGRLPVDLSVEAFGQVTLSLKGNVQDAMADLQYDVTLGVEPFSPRKAVAAIGVPFPVETADRTALDRVALRSTIRGTAQRVGLSEGVLELDDSRLAFSATVKDFDKPDLVFDLDLDSMDLDRYLPPPSEKPGEKPADAGKDKTAKAEETDYTPLRSLVLDGKARVGTLKAHGMTVREIDLKVTGRNGVIQLDPLLAKLYEGSLSAKGTVDVRQEVPRTALEFQTEGIQANPLLQDLLDKDIIEGRADAGAAVTMRGDRPEQIKRTLNGKGQFVFQDGAVKGIDLAGMVRNVTSAFRPGQETGGERPRTDFTEFNAPFTIVNGLVDTAGTTLASPLLRVLATGTANLVDESLDLRVEPKVVGTIKGQEDTKERRGIMVPVLVKGTFSAPSFQPDLKGVLEQQLKERGLPTAPKDLLKPQEGETAPTTERLKDVLRGLPGRK